MKTAVVVSLALVGVLGAPESRFACSECVAEMHDLGRLIRDGGPDIEADLADGYLMCLGAVVNHFFVDNAVHICQTMGVCDAWSRRYTCEECVEGLKWVEGYMEDPIQVAEYTLYLMQNVCIDDRCRELVAEHFPPMHWMAMEKFMIPQEICNTEPECTGEDPPTRPPTMF